MKAIISEKLHNALKVIEIVCKNNIEDCSKCPLSSYDFLDEEHKCDLEDYRPCYLFDKEGEKKESMSAKEDIVKLQEKEDLAKLIAEKERDIESLHKEIDKLEHYKKYEDSANETKAMLDAYINAGFKREEAFTILAAIMSKITI